jgi:transposase-like protein
LKFESDGSPPRSESFWVIFTANEKESRMKRTYQIDERKAIQRFRSHLTNDPGNIQLVLPLADIASRLRNGVDHMLFEAELQLLQLIMEDEVSWLTGARYQRRDGGVDRWGAARGSVIIHGQKVPIERPRIRNSNGDVKLGSYELFRREEEIQRRVWSRVMRGLTMRGYDPVIRERDRAFGLSKSTISDRFVLASAEQVNTLLKRDLSKLSLCALMVDGVEYCREHFVVALGIDQTGAKTILGFHQGATENQQICDQLLNGLASRGLKLKQRFIAVVDGGRAIRASIRKHCGEQALVQRCQLHKRRNVTDHFADDQKKHWDRKLANAYDLLSYQDAKRALNLIHHELMAVNPSAARSLEEGLDETLTVHRIGAPAELRKVLRTTNPIESAFSRVETVCRNVKRWRGGSHRERWIASALIFAEQKFRRVVGCKMMPKLMNILQSYTGDSKKMERTA